MSHLFDNISSYQTVLHCDRIMVLNQGMIEEFDTPHALLRIEGSYFKEIFDKNLPQKK